MDESRRRFLAAFGPVMAGVASAGCMSGMHEDRTGQEKQYDTLERSYEEVLAQAPELGDAGGDYTDTNRVEITEPLELSGEGPTMVYLQSQGGSGGPFAERHDALEYRVDSTDEACSEGSMAFYGLDGDEPVRSALGDDTPLQDCESATVTVEGYVVQTFRPVDDFTPKDDYGFVITDAEPV